MPDRTVLHIGFDDTDSPAGMCTTFLAYEVVGLLRKQRTEFLDFPRLIRLNPNVPWKTRGNGAVSLSIKTRNPKATKKQIQELVSKYSDVRNGANPGLVFLEGDVIPEGFSEFSSLALWQLISRNDAKKFAEKNGLEFFYHGNGQGLVGAIGAVGYKFDDSTLELLSYRKKSEFGKERRLSSESIRLMQERTAPRTFGSFDADRGRVLIAPHGPDPVFYGIRGEDVDSLLLAARMIKSDERPRGFMIFKSNQGTGDHLKNFLDPENLRPYSSGKISGSISCDPEITRGGHVFFRIDSGGGQVNCAVYRPTGIAPTASNLIKGDRVIVGGGVRRASKIHSRTLNLEFIDVLHLARDTVVSNPQCPMCHKSMKSKGQNQGFQCAICGRRSEGKVALERPRKLVAGLHLPSVSAHRHLTRPTQRLGVRNNAKFQRSTRFYVNQE